MPGQPKKRGRDQDVSDAMSARAKCSRKPYGRSSKNPFVSKASGHTATPDNAAMYLFAKSLLNQLLVRNQQEIGENFKFSPISDQTQVGPKVR